MAFLLAPWEQPKPRVVSRPSVSRPAIGGGIVPEAESALQRAMEYYQEGGGYGRGVEAGLERGRVKAVAGGTQALVSAGLAGTTMPAGLGKKYEEEVAMPARARVEETRAGAISGLEAMKAQIIQGATESARSRALQEYLAQLQASTSLQLGSMRQPSITRAPTRVSAPAPARVEQPTYEFPRAPSLVSGGGGGYTEPDFGPTEFGQYGEYYGAAYKKPGDVDYGPGSLYQQEKYGKFGAAFPS